MFPPTYPPPEGSNSKGPRHVVETLPTGEKRVLIDSVDKQRPDFVPVVAKPPENRLKCPYLCVARARRDED